MTLPVVAPSPDEITICGHPDGEAAIQFGKRTLPGEGTITVLGRNLCPYCGGPALWRVSRHEMVEDSDFPFPRPGEQVGGAVSFGAESAPWPKPGSVEGWKVKARIAWRKTHAYGISYWFDAQRDWWWRMTHREEEEE